MQGQIFGKRGCRASGEYRGRPCCLIRQTRDTALRRPPGETTHIVSVQPVVL